ncbi:hypothetical protein BDN70DRAFT_764508, partial [Pholiota conissans]
SQSLITKPRPVEIAQWMKNARKLNRPPKIPKPADFILSWRQWWVAMQPECRSNGTSWPLSHDLPDDGVDWTTLSYSGPNGFFLVVLSLGWW